MMFGPPAGGGRLVPGVSPGAPPSPRDERAGTASLLIHGAHNVITGLSLLIVDLWQ